MTRGNQRDTDRAKAQKKAAASVSWSRDRSILRMRLHPPQPDVFVDLIFFVSSN